MNYYMISKQITALYKGKPANAAGVTHRKLPRIQMGMLYSLSEELHDFDFAFSPFTHDGFARASTWERFNFDCYPVNSGFDFSWYLVSPKLKEVLEPLTFLTEHRFYKAELLNKNVLHPKFLLVWKKYERSTEEFCQYQWGYYTGVLKRRELQEVYTGEQIRDYEHYEKLSMARHAINGQLLEVKKIVINKAFDFADIPDYGVGHVVSQRFKDAVEAAGITGIEFEKSYIEIEIQEK
jgi:hypothetical protein